MIHSDTIKLLRECDAGIKMGIASIDDVLPHVTSDAFQKDLSYCKQEHEKLGDEIRQLLDKYHDDGKAPNPMAKTMSKMKTGMKLSMQETDARRLQHGCQIPEPVSEPVQSRRRSVQGHRQAAHQAGRPADSECPALSVTLYFAY